MTKFSYPWCSAVRASSAIIWITYGSRQSRASHAYRELALVVQTLDSATG